MNENDDFDVFEDVASDSAPSIENNTSIENDTVIKNDGFKETQMPIDTERKNISNSLRTHQETNENDFLATTDRERRTNEEDSIEFRDEDEIESLFEDLVDTKEEYEDTFVTVDHSTRLGDTFDEFRSY